MNDNTPQAPRVWFRRLKYGLNVAMLVIAALAIVIILNITAVRNVSRWGHWTRLDLTATREYTLSPQTRQVLSHLKDDLTIVTLFLTGSDTDLATAEKIRYFSDLLDEYERWGNGHITVKHIQPAIEVEKFHALCQQIGQRYKDKLQPAQNALTAVKQTLQQVSTFSKDQSTLFTHRMIGLKSHADPQLYKMLEQITQVLSSLDEQLDLTDLMTDIDKTVEAPLPDIAGIKSRVTEPLTQLRDNLLTPAVKAFNQRISSDDTKPDVKQFLLTDRDAFQKMLDQINKTTATLDSVNTSEYDAMRNSIMRANSSIVMTDDHINVIKLDDVYTDSVNTDPDQPRQKMPEQRFRGEEAVTSAIISLTMKVKPLVVFVNSAQQPAIGPRGAYNFVATQLRNMNFDIREWNPTGTTSPYGPTGPQPKPQPEKGQPVVWVILPQAPPNPQMPYMAPSGKIADILKDAIKDNQPCFVMLAPNPMARFGQTDMVAETLKGLGITLDNSVQIEQAQIDAQSGRAMASTQVPLTTWPTDHPISKALAGQVGYVIYSMPLTLTPKDGVTLTPLITTPADTWAETDQTSRNPKKDANEKSGPFTIAAAYASKTERLVVITDPYFATDQVTQYGPRDFLSGRLLHVLFPGNSDFFTNSVYWLAGQDDLIATGARSQDIRRYQAISPTAHIAVQWIVLLGLPLLCLAGGGVVWLMRRK